MTVAQGYIRWESRNGSASVIESKTLSGLGPLGHALKGVLNWSTGQRKSTVQLVSSLCALMPGELGIGPTRRKFGHSVTSVEPFAPGKIDWIKVTPIANHVLEKVPYIAKLDLYLVKVAHTLDPRVGAM
ncbi:hypothetical protein N7494_002380 [Penicillium frequentans]|uniref:Uncharacterized protein n=1 Tax=Penicillium frequentans TaxID=3151616 RepID=A0AAD6GHV6_9EURO|nr:hypothetical protein N7494_002380 [Penicillium glabrum]